ncbi:hypothetical protein M7I_0735 [Glarea lozoyensis 74030]|uniref:Uncharacterized protein n=1 Tax=Glarea lozoyensis (strain ATCC 74030 / MF5533) TaxID=1104152 RepID=H0EE63_GLAL7|nr:hypothetical protein M7I_0735 [Glarea lozoyensis 74030]
MEINTMNFGKGDYSTARKNNSKDMTGYLEDDPDYDPDHFHRGSSKEERMTRQILAQEKERQLEERLSMEGNGMGSAYMRAKNTSRPGAIRPQPQNDDGPPPPPDAAALGLLGGKAMDISLSPIKRKRVNTLSSTAGRGWGSGLAKDLNRMRDGENLQPVKKKTRFVTEKGIREAGRESIGVTRFDQTKSSHQSPSPAQLLSQTYLQLHQR